LSAPEAKVAAPLSATEQLALPVEEDAPPQESAQAALPSYAEPWRHEAPLPQPARQVRRKADSFAVEAVLDQRANRALRDTYASKAYELASNCIQFWIFLILANALIVALLGKQVVSDTALIAITTGVTVNVLAAFLGVIRGLFPADPKKPNGDAGN
jgi:hypothetical protein